MPGRSTDETERNAAEARELLTTFPPTEARDALIDLTDYTVRRKK